MESTSTIIEIKTRAIINLIVLFELDILHKPIFMASQK